MIVLSKKEIPMTKTKDKELWSLASIWNASLDTVPQRDYEARDRIWASELAGSYYDRYHKMHGRKATTPPNLRARRKFEAGNLIEWVVAQVLARAGALRSSQDYILNEKGAYKVSGKCDFIAGGMIEETDFSDLPETIADIAERAVAALKEQFPEGLSQRGLELKSCSGMMFDRYEKAPGIHHALQAFHYAYTTKMPYMIVYISRDDLRLHEWTILPTNKKLKKLYETDRENMAKIMTLNKKQIKNYMEQLLVWDEDDQKYKKNYKIEYSAYLTDYKYKQPADYAEPAQKIATRINGVIKRLREYKKISTLNEQAMYDAITFYPAIQPKLEQLINDWHVNYVKPEKVVRKKK
jgi:hypothetical protein